MASRQEQQQQRQQQEGEGQQVVAGGQQQAPGPLPEYGRKDFVVDEGRGYVTQQWGPGFQQMQSVSGAGGGGVGYYHTEAGPGHQSQMYTYSGPGAAFAGSFVGMGMQQQQHSSFDQPLQQQPSQPQQEGGPLPRGGYYYRESGPGFQSQFYSSGGGSQGQSQSQK